MPVSTKKNTATARLGGRFPDSTGDWYGFMARILHFGPYRSPPHRGYLDDARRGRVKVVGMTDAAIP
jgi:hypothetical protein